MSENNNSQIFIARIHPKVTERDLKHKFSKYGDIQDIRMKTGYAFIDFSKPEEAEEAIEKMDGHSIERQKVVVQKSKRIYKDKKHSSSKDKYDKDKASEDDSPHRYREKKGPQASDLCFNCGKEGHWANECREAVRPKRRDNSIDNIICFKCGKRGHKQRYCKGKRKYRSRSRSRSSRRRSRKNRRRDSSSSSRSDSRSQSSSRSRSRSKSRRSRSRSSSSSSRSGSRKKSKSGSHRKSHSRSESVKKNNDGQNQKINEDKGKNNEKKTK